MQSVLIVDDEEYILDILQRILVKLGCRTMLSISGESAMTNYKDDIYDVILLDVCMPRVDGFRIAREMKQLRPDQKIVMVTALSPSAVRDRAQLENINVDEILAKPFTYESVSSVIGRISNMKRTKMGSLMTSRI